MFADFEMCSKYCKLCVSRQARMSGVECSIMGVRDVFGDGGEVRNSYTIFTCNVRLGVYWEPSVACPERDCEQ